MAARPLRLFSPGEAKRFYDWLGSGLDLQRVFEDPAMDALVAHGGFDRARSVFELGCGTGRFAERLLARVLPGDARYEGADVSETMAGLATKRLRPWAARARVRLTDGSLATADAGGSFDRFVSTYVFDLLSADDIRTVLAEASRLLTPDGRLCLASMTLGPGGAPRVFTAVWTALHAFNPWLVGGCRPLRLRQALLADGWRLLYRDVLVAFGVPSEVIVACSPPHS
jgi:ubiquinone/menaquinone biosynthesis C-methylase UbiE